MPSPDLDRRRPRWWRPPPGAGVVLRSSSSPRLARPKGPDLGPVETGGRAVAPGCPPGAVHVDVDAVATGAGPEPIPAVGGDGLDQTHGARGGQPIDGRLRWSRSADPGSRREVPAGWWPRLHRGRPLVRSSRAGEHVPQAFGSWASAHPWPRRQRRLVPIGTFGRESIASCGRPGLRRVAVDEQDEPPDVDRFDRSHSHHRNLYVVVGGCLIGGDPSGSAAANCRATTSPGRIRLRTAECSTGSSWQRTLRAVRFRDSPPRNARLRGGRVNRGSGTLRPCTKQNGWPAWSSKTRYPVSGAPGLRTAPSASRQIWPCRSPRRRCRGGAAAGAPCPATAVGHTTPSSGMPVHACAAHGRARPSSTHPRALASREPLRRRRRVPAGPRSRKLSSPRGRSWLHQAASAATANRSIEDAVGRGRSSRAFATRP